MTQISAQALKQLPGIITKEFYGAQGSGKTSAAQKYAKDNGLKIIAFEERSDHEIFHFTKA